MFLWKVWLGHSAVFSLHHFSEIFPTTVLLLITIRGIIPSQQMAPVVVKPVCLTLSPCRRSSLSVAQSPRPDLSERCLPRNRPSDASSLPWRHPPCPGSLDQTSPPVIPARCFRPWRRVRSESRRRLIWRCSGKWLACPRIGNASTATSAARPMSTWQWAPSSAPPALAYCEFSKVLFLLFIVSNRKGRGSAVGYGFVRSTTDLAVPLAC